MAPIQDRHLAGLLMSLFSTNNPMSLFSVNNPDPNAWQSLLNGVSVLTNSFDPDAQILILSNSISASVIANAIQSARSVRPGQFFSEVGDILATPQLMEQSPFLAGLNPTNAISDEAYEAIPSQLLPLLRPDSVGAIVPVKDGWKLQFTGFDDFAYVLQTSIDLIHWEVVGTNYPVQGSFSLFIPSQPDSPARFYRSVLLP
jgi:hypothetical protein